MRPKATAVKTPYSPASMAGPYDAGMLRQTLAERKRLRELPRDELRAGQLTRLNGLLAAILPHNGFYAKKLGGSDLPLRSLEDFPSLPFTFKEELVTAPVAREFCANLTWPLSQYVRYHQTSGTRGKPMAILDTADDWNWWMDIWQFNFDAAEMMPDDRVLMAFSFGPFIGFWSAFEAAVARGCLVIPTGGMSTLARLEMIRSCRATVLLCTPSYALRMAEVAVENNIDIAALQVRRIIVAGEPGGSLPDVRRRIETAWNALVVDHAGASEVGPWGVGDHAARGLLVNESEFIAEFLSLKTGRPAEEGELSELVLTPLGRVGAPVIRYRTGDLVRPVWNHADPCRFVLLDGGVLGRVDDMLIVRGVNIFPSSIDQIVRSFPEVVEYRATARKQGEMDQLLIEIEDRLSQPERVARDLHLRLGLKVDVTCVPLGSLPRFEGKGKRFHDARR